MATRTTPKTAASTSADKPKRKPLPKKVAYPGLKDGTLLEEWPADWDAKTHKPLLRKHFTNEAVWLDHRADELETKANHYRKEAETARKLGNAKDRAKAKKLLAMRDRMSKLMEQLKSEGIDVDDLMTNEE